MLFNSTGFLIFFPLTTIIYFLLPHKFRWLLLLLSSCFFYMFFKPEYLLILLFTIVVDYFAGLLIESAKSNSQRSYYLLLSLIANIGVLVVFKYYNFINHNITDVMAWLGFNNPLPYLGMILPIGLSFHTFQAMSYTIEVYRGNQQAEKHFGIYALYVMFYPQLVAGPIERPQNMLHQFREKKMFDRDLAVSGLKLMLLGFFKKIVIADRLAMFVDSAFDNPYVHNTPSTIALGSIFFAFQIYADFSGYSDIAVGAARVLGIDLMRNFNVPFISKNITEFWRRWHISLSTWFNDYLFKPFVTVKRDWGKAAVVAGLMLTFTISGVWHGAGWTFVVFGMLHGFALVFEFISKKTRTRVSKKTPAFIYNSLSTLITFCFLVFAWIFFRAHSLQDSKYIITRMCHVKQVFSFSGIPELSVAPGGLKLSVLLISGLILFQHTRLGDYLTAIFARQPVYVRWLGYYLCIAFIWSFGVFGQRQFIYFQF